MATGAVLAPWALAVVLSHPAFQPPDAQLCLQHYPYRAVPDFQQWTEEKTCSW